MNQKRPLRSTLPVALRHRCSSRRLRWRFYCQNKVISILQCLLLQRFPESWRRTLLRLPNGDGHRPLWTKHLLRERQRERDWEGSLYFCLMMSQAGSRWSSCCLPACFSCLTVVWPSWETHRPQDSQQSAERQCHLLDLILAAGPVLLYFNTDMLYRSKADMLHNSTARPLDQPSSQTHTYSRG